MRDSFCSSGVPYLAEGGEVVRCCSAKPAVLNLQSHSDSIFVDVPILLSEVLANFYLILVKSRLRLSQI